MGWEMRAFSYFRLIMYISGIPMCTLFHIRVHARFRPHEVFQPAEQSVLSYQTKCFRLLKHFVWKSETTDAKAVIVQQRHTQQKEATPMCGNLYKKECTKYVFCPKWENCSHLFIHLSPSSLIPETLYSSGIRRCGWEGERTPNAYLIPASNDHGLM